MDSENTGGNKVTESYTVSVQARPRAHFRSSVLQADSPESAIEQATRIAGEGRVILVVRDSDTRIFFKSGRGRRVAAWK